MGWTGTMLMTTGRSTEGQGKGDKKMAREMAKFLSLEEGVSLKSALKNRTTLFYI